MMTKIVDRLRNAPRQPDCPHGLRPKSCKDCDIAGLEAEIERLRASLVEISLIMSCFGFTDTSDLISSTQRAIDYALDKGKHIET